MKWLVRNSLDNRLLWVSSVWYYNVTDMGANRQLYSIQILIGFCCCCIFVKRKEIYFFTFFHQEVFVITSGWFSTNLFGFFWSSPRQVHLSMPHTLITFDYIYKLKLKLKLKKCQAFHDTKLIMSTILNVTNIYSHVWNHKVKESS